MGIIGARIKPLGAAVADVIAVGLDRAFIRDYANIVKTEPILLTGEEAQDIVAALAKVKPEIKAFLVDYSNRLIR